MSFWLNDNRVIVCLRQIPFIHKILYSILLPSFVVLVWVCLFYLPTMRQINKLRPEIINLEKQVANFEDAVKLIEKEKILNTTLQLNAASFDQGVFGLGRTFDFLLSIMKRCNISCSSVNPLHTKLTQGFTKDYLNVVFKCRYNDLRKLCGEIKTQSTPLKFCYVKILRWKDGKIQTNIIFRNVRIDRT